MVVQKTSLNFSNHSISRERFSHFFLLLGYQEVTGLLSPHLLEDMLATLLEEDGIFGSYVDAFCLQRVLFAIDHIGHVQCTLWVWLVLHPLFGTCSLLGACVLTSYMYSHKCMC